MLEAESHLRPLQTSKSESVKVTSSDSPSNKVFEELKNEIVNLRKEVNEIKSNMSQKPTHFKKPNPVGNRKCYVCGSKYHLQAECPQGNVNNARYDRSSRSQSTQRRNNTYDKRRPVQNSFKSIRSRCAQVGIHQSDPEAGMYVRALVHGVKTNLLVDTGATLSVLSSI